MIYGGGSYSTTPYAGIQGAGAPDPNVDVDLESLGAGGRLTLVFNLPLPVVNDTIVDLDDLGDGGRLTLYFNKDFEPEDWFADAGELWKRVPLHSSVNFHP